MGGEHFFLMGGGIATFELNWGGRNVNCHALPPPSGERLTRSILGYNIRNLNILLPYQTIYSNIESGTWRWTPGEPLTEPGENTDEVLLKTGCKRLTPGESLFGSRQT